MKATTCYLLCMKPMKNHVKTIAFPAISTGVYGFPKFEAAKIALSVMMDYEQQFDTVIACCHSEEDFELYNKTILEIRRTC